MLKVLFSKTKLSAIRKLGLASEKKLYSVYLTACGKLFLKLQTCSTFCGSYHLDAPGTALSQRWSANPRAVSPVPFAFSTYPINVASLLAQEDRLVCI